MPSSVVLGFDAESLLRTIQGITLGTSNNVVEVKEEVIKVERHFHSDEYWLGARVVGADPEGSMADRLSMTPFEVDGGNDEYGTWVQLFGPDDTPVTPGYVRFDPHRILIAEEEVLAALFRLQFYIGATAPVAQDSPLASEIVGRVKNATHDSIPFDLREEDYAVGQKMWCRSWTDGQNAKFMRFFLGVHEYPE